MCAVASGDIVDEFSGSSRSLLLAVGVFATKDFTPVCGTQAFYGPAAFGL